MHVKRLQQFVSRVTGQFVKVTNVIRLETRKQDMCTVMNVVGGKLDKSSKRLIRADSLRRKYDRHYLVTYRNKFSWVC